MSDRQFPIQRERGAAAHPLFVPWSVAEKAYSVYSARYGTNQSLERLAERGGFAPSEMDEFFPAWRQETDITQHHTALLAALEALEQEMRRIADGYYKDPDEVAQARGDVWKRAAARLAAEIVKHGAR